MLAIKVFPRLVMIINTSHAMVEVINTIHARYLNLQSVAAIQCMVDLGARISMWAAYLDGIRPPRIRGEPKRLFGVGVTALGHDFINHASPASLVIAEHHC